LASVAGYVLRCYARPKKVTHRSTNRAWRRVTSMIRPTLRQTAYLEVEASERRDLIDVASGEVCAPDNAIVSGRRLVLKDAGLRRQLRLSLLDFSTAHHLPRLEHLTHRLRYFRRGHLLHRQSVDRGVRRTCGGGGTRRAVEIRC